ncbi:MAG: hypothetical protein Q4Q23_04080 [Methanobacteriaceae archaeon]|nr:hypothetical protein [Methanobacteriaceae archaeon]
MNAKYKIIITIGIVVFILLFMAINVNTINNILSLEQDHTAHMKNSNFKVPDGWDVITNLNPDNDHKISVTNHYLTIDTHENWIESNITDNTRNKIKASQENGGYEILKTETIKLKELTVNKEYYSNPNRDTNSTYDHIGIIYEFNKNNHNYMIHVHFLTTSDYNNQQFTNEIDEIVSYIANSLSWKIIDDNFFLKL